MRPAIFFIYSPNEMREFISRFYEGTEQILLVVLVMPGDYKLCKFSGEPEFVNPILEDWRQQGLLARKTTWKVLENDSIIGFVCSAPSF